jgi:hypothetical protein
LFVAFFCASILFVGVTLAFFASSDFANSNITMSGKVQIEAVGRGDLTVEDTASCNLEIYLDDTYEVLIPGMPIDLPANCKVMQSTTSPLLRAKLEVLLTNSQEDETEHEDAMNVAQNMNTQLLTMIKANGWHAHTDGYLYYIGTSPIYNSGGKPLLFEVNVTDGPVVVDFINDTIEFPTFVDETYSGFGIKFKITFQAIQNYIPDEYGDRLENTIENSIDIFETIGTIPAQS